MEIVCYFRSMKTLSKTLLLLTIAFIFMAVGCKKDDDVDDKQDQTPEAVDCISLITPMGNSEALQNLEFKWSSCEDGPYTFELFLGQELVLDTVVGDTSFVYNDKMLISDTLYKWNVSAGDSVSEPATFRTQLTDSFFVGTYRMNKSGYWYSGPNSGSSDLGEVIISIVSLGPNYIQIQDSAGTPIFATSYSSYQTNAAVISYGGPYGYGNSASFNMLTGYVSIKQTHFQGAGGGDYTYWGGYKIP